MVGFFHFTSIFNFVLHFLNTCRFFFNVLTINYDYVAQEPLDRCSSFSNSFSIFVLYIYYSYFQLRSSFHTETICCNVVYENLRHFKTLTYISTEICPSRCLYVSTQLAISLKKLLGSILSSICPFITTGSCIIYSFMRQISIFILCIRDNSSFFPAAVSIFLTVYNIYCAHAKCLASINQKLYFSILMNFDTN